MYEYNSRPMGQDEDAGEAQRTHVFTIETPVGPRRRVAMRIQGPSGLEHTCSCYEDFPRDMVAAFVRPHAVEFSTGLFGKKYECVCDPMWTTCPPEMRPIPASPEYAAKKKECDAFIAESKVKLPEAQRDIENEQFRLEVARKIARAFGVSESRVEKIKPAEFLTVVEERSRRARGIWVLSAITVAAGGSLLLWQFLRGRKGQPS